MKDVLLAWRLLFWLVVVAIVIIRMIWVARSKRMHHALEDRATNDLIERARTLAAVPIAQMPEGQVARVLGQVRALETLAAPLDKRACVSWRVMISVLSPAEGAHWELISEHTDGTPFVLADATGECCIDPATAAFGLQGGRARTFKRGQALPSDVASYCVDRGLSLDDLRSKSIYVVEQILPVGAKISVTGIGERVTRTVANERDYRASEPTWIVMTARSVDLLISNAKPLLDAKATRSGEAEWPGLRHAKGESPDDDFERRILASRKRMQRVVTIVPLTILAGIGIAIFASSYSKTKPDVMTDVQRAELEDALDKHRIAAYRSDDGWRAALSRRHGAASVGDCPELKDAPVATLTSDGELPLQSGRTDVVLRRIGELEAEIKAAKGSQYASLRERIAAMTFPTFDVLLDGSDESARRYVYDHAKGVIVCVEPGAVTGP
ncbi:MAG: GIDE domain-containing protein [Kofleriaceae bacterium]